MFRHEIRFGRPDATEDNKATFPQAYGGIGEADPNIMEKVFQFKTFWRWSWLHSMFFTRYFKELVRQTWLVESSNLIPV